jgi:hypothetical protein
LAACKIILRGMGVICPPGKQHSENLQTSAKSISEHYLKTCSDLGPTESKRCCLLTRTPASYCSVFIVCTCLNNKHTKKSTPQMLLKQCRLGVNKMPDIRPGYAQKLPVAGGCKLREYQMLFNFGSFLLIEIESTDPHFLLM